MEYVRDSDKTHKGYKYYIDVQEQINKGDQKDYLARLTETQKADLNKYKTLLRQRKFSSQDNNKEIYNAKRQEHITHLRTTEPEKMAQQNRKDVKNYKLRNKAKEQEILTKLKQTEAKQTITDAIRARKARAELKELSAKATTKSEIADILNSIIDTIPKKAQQKRNREAVAKHRAKKAQGEQTQKYKTKSKTQ